MLVKAVGETDKKNWVAYGFISIITGISFVFGGIACLLSQYQHKEIFLIILVLVFSWFISFISVSV